MEYNRRWSQLVIETIGRFMFKTLITLLTPFAISALSASPAMALGQSCRNAATAKIRETATRSIGSFAWVCGYQPEDVTTPDSLAAGKIRVVYSPTIMNGSCGDLEFSYEISADDSAGTCTLGDVVRTH